MSEAFSRIARLQLERLRAYADRLAAGEADPPSLRQAAERLRRFVLAAQEGGVAEVKPILEEIEANLERIAAEGPSGASWLIERIESLAAAVEGLPATPAEDPRRSRAPRVEAEAPGVNVAGCLSDLEESILEAEAIGAPGLALRLRRTADQIRGSTLVPLTGVLDRVLDLGRRTASDLGREVAWLVTGRGTAVEREVATFLEGQLVHLAANAIQHGFDKARGGRIWVAIEFGRGGLGIAVTDDGRGAPAFQDGSVFASGAARGGLASLAAEVRSRGGDVRARSEPGGGAQVEFRLPVARVAFEALIVQAGGPFAFPAERVREVAEVRAEGPSPSLAQILWPDRPADGARSRIVLETARGPRELAVEGIGGRRSILVHPIELPAPSPVAGIFREDTRIGYVLDPDALPR